MGTEYSRFSICSSCFTVPILCLIPCPLAGCDMLSPWCCSFPKLFLKLGVICMSFHAAIGLWGTQVVTTPHSLASIPITSFFITCCSRSAEVSSSCITRCYLAYRNPAVRA
jgi:hypothetical protein